MEVFLTMIVNMGCKIWTSGEQKGLRIYVSTIRNLTNVLYVPSSNNNWPSLHEFLEAIRNGEEIEQPYTRNLLVISTGKECLSGHLSINKHGNTSQGYITASRGTWFEEFIDDFLDVDENFEYLVGFKHDVLIIP